MIFASLNLALFVVLWPLFRGRPLTRVRGVAGVLVVAVSCVCLSIEHVERWRRCDALGGRWSWIDVDGCRLGR